MSEHRARPITLLVGPDVPRRHALAAEIMAAGSAVVICAGPPGCALAREERCVLIDASDARVVMGEHPAWADDDGALRACAEAGRARVSVPGGRNPDIG